MSVQERNQLSIQLTNLQVDFDNINARLEEETENANSLRSQLQKAVADYQTLKSRFDKELLVKTEELEEIRQVQVSRDSRYFFCYSTYLGIANVEFQRKQRKSVFDNNSCKLTFVQRIVFVYWCCQA